MNWNELFNQHPVTPDFEAFRRVVLRQGKPTRVHHAELYLDELTKSRLASILDIEDPAKAPNPIAKLQREVELNARLGMDIVRIHRPDSEFTMDRTWDKADDATAGVTALGYRVHEHAGPIQAPEDVERYRWPRVDNLDLSLLEWAEKNLPDGMKAYDLSAQFLECANWLLGYETFFVSILDEPEFLDEVLSRIADFYLAYIRVLCDFGCVGAIWAADDMGFKTQTMVRPEWLRENIIPLHQKAAAIAHEHGKLYLLHSCGKVDSLMEDFITTIKADGKHSFEDVIEPVECVHASWGDRIGILGGIDVDYLSRADRDSVARRSREVLELCHHRGGYVLGSGNSVTSYIPPENYLAMILEGRRFQ